MKELNLDQTIHSAVKKYPELAEVIAELGFPQVRNAFILSTVGKRLTLQKAIEQSGLEREQIIETLSSKGFSIAE